MHSHWLYGYQDIIQISKYDHFCPRFGIKQTVDVRLFNSCNINCVQVFKITWFRSKPPKISSFLELQDVDIIRWRLRNLEGTQLNSDQKIVQWSFMFLSFSILQYSKVDFLKNSRNRAIIISFSQFQSCVCNINVFMTLRLNLRHKCAMLNCCGKHDVMH